MKLNKLINTKDLSHKEWLEYRKKGIGGSDAGAICGLNPYVSPIKVFLNKTSDEVVETKDNEAMRQGRDLEDYVAKRFEEETNLKVRRANAIFKNDDYPFMFANVDRLVVGEDAGLECKTVSPYLADKWEGGNIPPSYEIQCHHYMAVTGANSWYIAGLIFGKQFIFYKINRDDELIKNLISIEKNFWEENVLKNEMPAPDGSKDTEELLKQFYPKSNGESIELYGFDEKLKRRDEITELIEKLSLEKNEIEQEIKVYMGEAEKATSNNYNISWKSSVTARIDSKKLKAEQNDIYNKYLKESISRRFLVKRIGE